MVERTPTFEKPEAEDAVSGAQLERSQFDAQDHALRPKALKDFVGQAEAREALDIAIGAAKGRGEMPDHILFFGPPGLGKTTLAAIVAAELGVPFRQTSAPAIGKPGDMAAILASVEPNSVLFIDEIHRLNAATSEMLYTAMEDFAIDLVVGDSGGPGGRSVRIELPRFTLIGATTRSGALQSALLTRFGISVRLNYYESDDLAAILERDARLLGLNGDVSALRLLAGRSRGTPRVAKKYLRRVRDWADINNGGLIDAKCVDGCLAMLRVDELGLDSQDRRYLDYLIRMRGRPVGIGTMAAALSEDPVTIEFAIEPFLLKCGLIQRTQRGRIATQEAIDRYGRLSAA